MPGVDGVEGTHPDCGWSRHPGAGVAGSVLALHGPGGVEGTSPTKKPEGATQPGAG